MESGNVFSPDCYVGHFGDVRLRKSGALFLSRMIEQGSVCLRRIAQNRAEEMRFGRWLRNARVTCEEITREASKRTGIISAGLHVLAVHDTSEINYQAHAGRTRGLGKICDVRSTGLFIHPMLAIDAQTKTCLGLVHQHTWTRTRVAGLRARPIEEKESYRWLKAAQICKQCLHQARMITVIADRESDIYEEWDRIPDRKTHLLTRICRDRKLANGALLCKWLDQQCPQACYRFPVNARPAKTRLAKVRPGSKERSERKGKRSAHDAHMDIRYGQLEIVRPDKCRDKTAKKSVHLWAVEVREHAQTVVGKEEPVCWRLLTTHCIESVEAALQIVDWYRERWQIEQLFRTLKKQGLDIESSQLEEAGNLLKLASLATQAATRTLQLTMAREDQSERSVTNVFNDHEVAALHTLHSVLQGPTIKQTNPYPPGRSAWAAWIIARLGGWKGYKSEAKPGPITMYRGQQRFASMVQGWKLAKICA